MRNLCLELESGLQILQWNESSWFHRSRGLSVIIIIIGSIKRLYHRYSNKLSYSRVVQLQLKELLHASVALSSVNRNFFLCKMAVTIRKAVKSDLKAISEMIKVRKIWFWEINNEKAKRIKYHEYFFKPDLRNWPISEKRANVPVKQFKVPTIGIL